MLYKKIHDSVLSSRVCSSRVCSSRFSDWIYKFAKQQNTYKMYNNEARQRAIT